MTAGRTKIGGVEIDVYGDSSHYDRTMNATPRTARRANNVIRGEFRKTGAVADATSRKIKGMGTSLIALGAAAGLGLTVGVTVLKDFGQAMSTLEAVTGASASEMQLLEAEARRLGSTTRFSGTQAAEGMIFLARAGFTAAEALEAVEGTLKLAQAGGLDLGRAADIASNVLGGFNLGVEHTARVVDVLAAAANASNVTVNSLGEGLKFAAPAAAALGLEMEEVIAILGKLGDSGIAGGLGGRGFSAFATSLVAKKKDIEAIIGPFDAAAEGIDGVIKRMVEAGTSAEQVIKIFGAANLDIYTILANSSQDAAKGTAVLTQKLRDAANTADRVATTMDENLNGAILATISALQEVVLALGEVGGNPALIASFKGLTRLFQTAGKNADILGVAMIALAARGMLPLVTSTVPAVLAALRGMVLGLEATTAAAARTRVAMSLAFGPATLLIAGAAAAYVLYARNAKAAAEVTERAQSAIENANKALRETKSLVGSSASSDGPMAVVADTAERAFGRVTELVEKLGDLKKGLAAIRKEGEGAALFQVAESLLEVKESRKELERLRSETVSRRANNRPNLAGREGRQRIFEQELERFNTSEAGKQLAFIKQKEAVLERRLTLLGKEVDFQKLISEFWEGTKGQPDDKPGGGGGSSTVAGTSSDEAANRAKLLSELELAFDLEFARAEQNEKLVRILEDEIEIRARTLDYIDAGKVATEAEAIARAEILAIRNAEARAAERAATADAAEGAKRHAADRRRADEEARRDRQGDREDNEAERARRVESLKEDFADAIMRAVTSGDVKGTIKDIFREQATKGLRKAIDNLTDALFALFQQSFGAAQGGSGGGGSGFLGAVAAGVGAIFGGGSGVSGQTPGITGPISQALTSPSVTAKGVSSAKGLSMAKEGDMIFNIAGDVSEKTVDYMAEKLSEHRKMLPGAVRGVIADEQKRGAL